ncbi:hypothetical protein [Brevundimonas sp. Root1423]|uniref:hypothetical protein n=1 Tax=Brevundimonas sp. Root1423 TaxID=1736462 RepID=UPI000AABFC1C|nr:hypothetical protein [Brevundimonas sp. Root1423]
MITAIAVALLTSQTPVAMPRNTDRVSADRLVCRNEPQPATRIPKRVCMTALEWSGLREAVEHNRARVRPIIDNRRPGRVGGRS